MHPGKKVALRNGMTFVDRDTKNFRNTDMEFFLYRARRQKDGSKPETE